MTRAQKCQKKGKNVRKFLERNENVRKFLWKRGTKMSEKKPKKYKNVRKWTKSTKMSESLPLTKKPNKITIDQLYRISNFRFCLILDIITLEFSDILDPNRTFLYSSHLFDIFVLTTQTNLEYLSEILSFTRNSWKESNRLLFHATLWYFLIIIFGQISSHSHA